MNIVKPYARISGVHDRAHGVDLLRKIEWIGRISHRSEDAQTVDSWDRFLRAVILQHGDWSIAEHVSVTVDACVDRGITHEWVRHRIGAYTQESTRFVNYQKRMMPSFIVPLGIDLESQAYNAWECSIDEAETAYRNIIAAGLAPQIARSVFPNALASRLVVTYNLRMWRHFLLMRTTREAHPQMRQVTIPLLEEFQEKIPILFEDIVPLSRQSEAMSRMR